MKKRYILISLFLIGFLFLSGCGGGGTGGAPGSGGSEDTGILIRAVSIVRAEGPDLDAAIHLCPPANTEWEDGLFRDSAVITINATLVNALYDSMPGTVEECTITYFKANEDPASPIIESLTIYPNCAIIDSDENACSVTLMDINRKTDYWTDINFGLNVPNEYPTHYIARFDCKYYNIYREDGTFQIEYDIWLADFDVC